MFSVTNTLRKSKPSFGINIHHSCRAWPVQDWRTSVRQASSISEPCHMLCLKFMPLNRTGYQIKNVVFYSGEGRVGFGVEGGF